jgi:hypothetical protein
MRIFIVFTIVLMLLSCGSTENATKSHSFSNSSQKLINSIGGALPVDKKWYAWDTCGQPNAYSNATVYEEVGKVYIDFAHFNKPIAFDGTYDRDTALLEVAGTTRADNGRTGKGAREGIYSPETDSIVLFKVGSRTLNTDCIIILSLNRQVIESIQDGHIVLPERFDSGDAKKQINAACNDGRTAEWINRYIEKTPSYQTATIESPYAPDEFRKTFGTEFSQDALTYLSKSLADNNLCGLEQILTKGEILSNQAKLNRLLYMNKYALQSTLINNFIIGHHDAWVLRASDLFTTQDNSMATEKLNVVNEVIKTSEIIMRRSLSAYKTFSASTKAKRDSLGTSIVNEQLNGYQTKTPITLADLDEVAKLRDTEQEIYSYLDSSNYKLIQNSTSTIINKDAPNVLTEYLTRNNNISNTQSLVEIETKYQEIFFYLSDDIKHTVLSLRANYVYDFINEELTKLNGKNKLQLDDLIEIARHDINNPLMWKTLSNNQLNQLNSKREAFISLHAPSMLMSHLKETEAEEIYEYKEFYYGKAAPLIAKMQLQDQSALESAFLKRLNGYCDFDMAIVAFEILNADDIKDSKLALDRAMHHMDLNNDVQRFCFAKAVLNSDTTIVQNQAHFIHEARARFDNSVKHCKVLPDAEIKFLETNTVEVPLYESILLKSNKVRDISMRAIYQLGLNLSDMECKQKFPLLPFKFLETSSFD